MKYALFALAAAGLAAGPVLADPPAGAPHHPVELAAKVPPLRAGKIIMEGSWARATKGTASEVYASFRNTGTKADRLIGARTAVAKRVELHKPATAGKGAPSKPVKSIAAPPGKKVSMSSRGSEFIKLIDLTRPLRHGDDFELTLIFERSGEVTITVSVFPG